MKTGLQHQLGFLGMMLALAACSAAPDQSGASSKGAQAGGEQGASGRQETMAAATAAAITPVDVVAVNAAGHQPAQAPAQGQRFPLLAGERSMGKRQLRRSADGSL